MNIVDLAQSLNLSIGTVSRALNDRPEVSPRTRQRVLEKARETNFAPNPNARRLVTGKNSLIQFDCPNNPRCCPTRSWCSWRGRRGRPGRAPLRPAAPFRRQPPGRGARQPQSRGRADSCRRPRNPRRRHPGAVARRAGAHRRHLRPYPSGLRGLQLRLSGHAFRRREALRLLAQQGHRRVGFIGSGLPGCRVRAVFSRLAREAGLAWDETLTCELGVSQADGGRAALALLALPDPPTALVARTDVLALGAIHAVQSSGRRVPEDVSVIGHDDIEFAAMVSPPLTTVGIDTVRAGRAATGALLDMLTQNAAPTVQTVHARLVLRRSSGPALNS